MAGFKNAPSVTEWKVGMEFLNVGHHRCRVLWVDAKGLAHGINDSDGFPLDHVPLINFYELDLSSIWQGREYHDKTRKKAVPTRVVMVSDEYVAFTKDGMLFCRSKSDFVERYEPLPLAPPVEADKTCATCGDPECHMQGQIATPCTQYKPKPAEAKPWRPKQGDTVLRVGAKVEVLGVWGNLAWIPWAGTATTVGIDELRPLPPEPSEYKVGDKVWLVGKVHVGQDHGFGQLDFGTGREFEVTETFGDKLGLQAEGFGQPGARGNGCLYVCKAVVRREPAESWKP